MVKKTKGSFSSIKYAGSFASRKYAGTHLIVDFWNGKNIEEPRKIKKILFQAAKEANNTPLKVSIHKFYPHGLTGVILLAESHIAIHAWPEINYLAIDIFTCGKRTMPYLALKYLKTIFQPQKITIKEIKRGRM